MSELATLAAKIRYKLKVFLLEGLLRPLRPMDMVRFGTYYGGWWIRRVDPSLGAAICVGAGLDVSFDLELLRLGYRVYTVDPTPESVHYVREAAPKLDLVPVGIWDRTGELRFYRDANPASSWSAAMARGTDPVLRRFPVTTVAELLQSVGETRLAVLKLDIEGAEHRVLRSIVKDNIRPDCLCVEFDDQRLSKVLASVRLLRHYGYALIQIENWNYTFTLQRGRD
jgi:FkbM family methyltransferase